MNRRPRNARTERLTDWRFFIQIYLVSLVECHRRNRRPTYPVYRNAKFIGLMMWPSAMSMWFLYMSEQGLRFHDVILVYDKWADGYKGFSIGQLNHFVAVGQCI